MHAHNTSSVDRAEERRGEERRREEKRGGSTIGNNTNRLEIFARSLCIQVQRKHLIDNINRELIQMQQNHPPIQLPVTMMGDRATNSEQVIGREKKRQQRMKEAAKEGNKESG